MSVSVRDVFASIKTFEAIAFILGRNGSMNTRVCYGAILLLALPLAAAAADAPNEVTIIKLSVEAKAAPKPALKYWLLPELKDMQQGNPVPAYYKCFMEQTHLYFEKKASEDRQKWSTCPLADLPKETEWYGGSSTKQADYAARLDACDWQILTKLKTEGGNMLLPEVQQLRSLAAVLKVRYRGQIKAGKFDEAIKTHQTMFALARHLGEHPAFIGNLTGIAIATIAISPMEEMIQRPGCPNLFWAITQLPSPLVDVRKGMRSSRLFVFAELGQSCDPSRVWSEDDLRKVGDWARQHITLTDGTAKDKKETRATVEKWVLDRLKDEKWLSDTRQNLIAAGLPEAKVMKYPREQVMFQNLLTKFEAARDDVNKLFAFPYWQAEPGSLQLEKPGPAPTEEDTIVKTQLVFGPLYMRDRACLDQRIAMLQIVEALRLHAAENDSKLPADLRDIKLPLPVDPITGKLFVYKLEDATAILQSTPPKAQEPRAKFNAIRYEVTIRK